MSNSDKKAGRGRPTVFPKALGPGEQDTIRFPTPVLNLLKRDDVKLLLGWMALKPKILERAIMLIPKKEREAKLSRQVEQPTIMQNSPDGTDPGL